MVNISSIVASLAVLLPITAKFVTVPLGTSGASLSISEDGKSIPLDGKIINIRDAINNEIACQRGGHGRKNPTLGNGHGKGANPANAKAIYFITNAANNSIVALKVAANGTLSDGSITLTGGAGMNGVDSTGAPAAPDSLFSQGALKVAGNVSIHSRNPT